MVPIMYLVYTTNAQSKCCIIKNKLFYKLKILILIIIIKLFYSYFCTGVKPGELNQIPEMEQCGLWQDIISAKNLVAHHSDSLIHLVNNNCVENYNSIVAKFTGGKRINFSLRGKKIHIKYLTNKLYKLLF